MSLVFPLLRFLALLFALAVRLSFAWSVRLARVLALSVVLGLFLGFGLFVRLGLFLPLALGLTFRSGLSRLLLAAFLVLADLFGQLAGALGHFVLVLGHFARFGAALGASLNALLQPQDAFDLFDVLANPVLLAFQAVGTVLAQQHLQQPLHILMRLALQSQQPLPLGSVFRLELLQRLDAFVQLDARQVLLGQLQRLHQQRRASRIIDRLDTCHVLQQLLELRVLVGDRTLVNRQLLDVGHGRGLRFGRLGCRRRLVGGPRRTSQTKAGESRDP